jgi:hypothetical protein
MNTPSHVHVRKIAAILCAALGVIVAAAGVWVWRKWGSPFSFSAFLFLFIIVAAFLRAGYLAWFRWSPLAVRHVMGALFFPLTLWLMWAVPPPFGWMVLPICYVAYRLAAFQWSRCEFIQSVPKATHRN